MSSKIKLSCINAQKIIFMLVSMVHSATTKDPVTIHSVTLDSLSASLVVQCAASWEFHDLQTLTHLGSERVAGNTSARSVAKHLLLNKGHVSMQKKEGHSLEPANFIYKGPNDIVDFSGYMTYV